MAPTLLDGYGECTATERRHYSTTEAAKCITVQVRNYDDAINSETARFNKPFHYALENGVCLPPSPYETGFICTAHDGNDIKRATEILAAGLKAM